LYKNLPPEGNKVPGITLLSVICYLKLPDLSASLHRT